VADKELSATANYGVMSSRRSVPQLHLLVAMMMMMMVVVAADVAVTRTSSQSDESTARGCLGLGYCCRGRNVSCSSTGQRSDNKDETATCFCDEECLSIGDCCLDYRAACQRTSPAHIALSLAKAQIPLGPVSP